MPSIPILHRVYRLLVVSGPSLAVYIVILFSTVAEFIMEGYKNLTLEEFLKELEALITPSKFINCIVVQ